MPIGDKYIKYRPTGFESQYEQYGDMVAQFSLSSKGGTCIMTDSDTGKERNEFELFKFQISYD